MPGDDNSKSQFGEDLILANYFQGKKDGFYVEVGACDGIYFSNTFYFEQIGWTGILVEPVPQLAERCRQMRTKSQVVDCAIVAPNSARQVQFTVIDGYEPFSSLSLKFNDVMGDVPKTRQIVVPAKTLDQVLEEYNVTQIDFLTIDVEGHEFTVLEGFDIARWHPKVVILERTGDLPDFQVIRYMHSDNYAYERRTGWNDWYLPVAPGYVQSLSYRIKLFTLVYVPGGLLAVLKAALPKNQYSRLRTFYHFLKQRIRSMQQ